MCLDCTKRALDSSKYCADHQSKNRASENKRMHDHYRADDPIRLLYKSSRWYGPFGTRLIVLRRDPLCCECGNHASTVADHHPLEAREIVEQFGVKEFYKPARSRGLCKQCHDIKTATTAGFASGGAKQ